MTDEPIYDMQLRAAEVAASKPKSTPGPWRATDDGYVVAGSGREVADCAGRSTIANEEGVANARLIAAAPEMYAALRVAAEALDFAMPSSGSPLHAILASAHKQAESALAKAEGREVQP